MRLAANNIFAEDKKAKMLGEPSPAYMRNTVYTNALISPKIRRLLL